jgi:hypothetical protein
VAKGLRTAGQGLRIGFGVRVSQEEKDKSVPSSTAYLL